MTLAITLWAENSETIREVKRGGQPSIPAIKLKCPIEAWTEITLRTGIMAQFCDWRRQQGLETGGVKE